MFDRFREDNPPVLAQIAAAAIHPDTQELFILDPHGFIFACPPDRFTITFICSLHSPPDDSSSSDEPSFEPTKSLHIFVKHHLLFVLHGDNICRVYDLKVNSLLFLTHLRSRLSIFYRQVL
jgi:hypothetical protein